MKNLIILGAIRSGKSTLTNKLINKGGFNAISMDYLSDAIVRTFPETGIKDDGELDCAAFNLFMEKIFSTIEREKLPYVSIVEGNRISPRAAVAMVKPEVFKIVVLGYPQLIASDVMTRIRKKEKDNDWTVDISDEDLLKIISIDLERGKLFKKECDELGLCFIDTSFDVQSKLEDFINNIDNFLN